VAPELFLTMVLVSTMEIEPPDGTSSRICLCRFSAVLSAAYRGQ